MKALYIGLLLVACCAAPVPGQEAGGSVPAIGLFDSVERVESFLKNEAVQDYSDKYLSGIRLEYIEGHPRKGLAWVYSFSFRKPRLGGDISIFHYMDGEIVEFHHGP